MAHACVAPRGAVRKGMPLMSGSATQGGRPIPLVLIVDDSATQLLQLQKLFRLQGMEVVTAVDGISGLHAAYQHFPDAVIADTEMPVLGGFGLCWMLKDDAAMAGIPLILLRSAGEESIPFWQAHARADYLLSKNEDPKVLVQTVWNAIMDHGYPGMRLRAGVGAGTVQANRGDALLEEMLVQGAVRAEISRLARFITAGNRHEMARAMFDVLSAAVDYRAAGVFFLQPTYATFFLHTLESLPSDQLNSLLHHAVVPLRGILRGTIRLELFLADEQTPRELGRWTPQTTTVPSAIPVLVQPLQSAGQTLGSIGMIGSRQGDPRVSDILGVFADHFSLVLNALYLYEDSLLLRRETERVRTGAATGQQALLQIVEQGWDGVFLADASGRLTAWNNAAARLTGYTAESMIGRQLVIIDQQDLGEMVLNLANQPVVLPWPSGSASAEYRVQTREGRDAWIGMTRSILHDPDGRPLSQVFIFHDIWAYREVARLRDGISGIVADDLHTPSSVLHDLLGKLLRQEYGPLEPMQRSALESAWRYSEHLSGVAGELVGLLQNDSGPRLRLRPTDVAAIMQEAAELVRTDMQEKRLRFEVQLPTHLPVVRADGAQLAQALHNLLDNALKFTLPGGAVTMWVTIEQQQMHIAVQDTGIGISAADQQHLFQKFFHAENALAGERAGSGLGLSSSKAIVGTAAPSACIAPRARGASSLCRYR